MKITVILQARMSSNRLPGKVLKLILGLPMLAHQVLRVQRATQVDKVIIATSDHASDDDIANLCRNLNVTCFRGNLNNVLDRFYQAHLLYPSEHIVRLTGDCPLTDPATIDNVIIRHKAGGFDYTSNCEPATFPDGLDVEVMTSQALKSAWLYAIKPSELEHVTPFIRNNPEQFNCGSFINERDLSAHRWTVDEQADFNFVEKIYQDLYPSNKAFDLQDILKHLDKYPDLIKINQGIIRNEGLLKSLKIDNEHGYD